MSFTWPAPHHTPRRTTQHVQLSDAATDTNEPAVLPSA